MATQTDQDKKTKIRKYEIPYPFKGFTIKIDSLEAVEITKEHPLYSFINEMVWVGSYQGEKKNLMDKVLQICDENGKFMWEGQRLMIASVNYERVSGGITSREGMLYSEYLEWGKPKKLIKERTEIIRPS